MKVTGPAHPRGWAPHEQHCRFVSSERNARIVLGFTSVLVAIGLVVQFFLAIGKDAHPFAEVPARILNFFSFFTVQSNIAVAVTTGLLAANLHRPSTLFRMFRIVAVVCIAVTGIVFHLALADLQELTGWDLVCDTILHTLSPILATAGWLFFGPRGQLSTEVVVLAVVPPVGWLGYAFIYGELATTRTGEHYYAYPFMNVEIHGYAVALFRCVLVAALFLGLAFGAKALDRRLPGVRPTSP